MNISVNGFTDLQMELANFIWNCRSAKDLQTIIETYGTDAIIVRDMILAEGLDTFCDDLSLANDVINQIKGNMQ